MGSREQLTQIFVRHNALAGYLFGSQVKGMADPMSDVDIGVIFGGKDISIHSLLILQDDLQRLFGSTPVDLVLLDKASVTVAFQAISQGEILYSANDDL
ncbi:MAG TPA: nucleotidyltransferase domain-containing protein [Limnochordia bacterium]|nr:nucleotidyltransferase domain-containing protein [Limnochordia bacterium]